MPPFHPSKASVIFKISIESTIHTKSNGGDENHPGGPFVVSLDKEFDTPSAI
jgi:hypothetical protein